MPKEFWFEEKPRISICGKQYECDPTDPDLIRGVMRDFPQITSLASALIALKNRLNAAARERDSKKIHDISQEALEKNEEILLACQNFIFGTVGEEEYKEIFSGRRPNAAEHISLCTHIFEHITEGRISYLKEYLDPPAENADACR